MKPKKGNRYRSTDTRRPGLIEVVHVGKTHSLCATFCRGRYRTEPKQFTRRIRNDRLTPKSHWKLVRAA